MTMHVYPGRVLHVDPDCLCRLGALYTASDEHRVRRFHFFVCFRTSQSEGLWLDWHGRIDRSVIITVLLGACHD
jgi:hypothetical protein